MESCPHLFMILIAETRITHEGVLNDTKGPPLQ